MDAIEAYDVDAARAALAGAPPAVLGPGLRAAASLSEAYAEELIAELLELVLTAAQAAGVRVDDADEHGRTPLILAVLAAQPASVDRLLDAGADPGSRSKLGTALDVAKSAHRRRRSPEIIARLTAAKAPSTDLSRARGVRSFEGEETIALVPRPPAEVAAAYTEHLDRHATHVALPAAGEAPLVLGRRAVAFFRLRGHRWTVVSGVTEILDVGDAGAAAVLSRALDDEAFLFSCSETGGACALVHYQAGVPTRRWTRTGPDRVRGNWRKALHKVLLEADAFAPGVRFRGAPGRAFEGVPGLDAEDVELALVMRG